MIDCMIFSKNRPMQLHCLLESIKYHTDLKTIKVLHRYDEKYLPGLKKLVELHPSIEFIEESNFESQVKDYLREGPPFCVFLVDDIIMKNRVEFLVPCRILEMNPVFINFSLRLGTHLSYCYPNKSSQQLPNGKVDSGFFIWGWKGAHHDWSYPFSVDGHIFRRAELESWVSHLKFKNPNQFEAEMQSIKDKFALPEASICYANSALLNTPINRVQNEFNNRAEGGSIDELYDLWMSGKCLDFSSVSGVMNDGAHTPVTLPLKDL